MFKKYLLSSALLMFAVFALTSPVFAEERASTTERREEIRQNIEQRKASSTERRTDMQIDIAKRKVENVTRVILATIERLEKIILRIESRIAKIQERGGNTTEAEGYVAAAKENRGDKKVAGAAFATLDLSDSPFRKKSRFAKAAT